MGTIEEQQLSKGKCTISSNFDKIEDRSLKCCLSRFFRVNHNRGQVHSVYPKTSGSVGEYIASVMFMHVLGYPAPNVSVVLESPSDSPTNDGSPNGCYGSLHRNESDITFMPIEYPVLDYDKVDPIQVVDEGPLSIISTYNVSANYSTVYADILKSSFNSFDTNVWTIVVLAFFVFVGLLFVRKSLNPEKKNDLSPTFETFSHMLSQESSDFDDESGKAISFTMTISFYLIMLYYLGLMSTDLVVVAKPHVINNYTDIMNKKTMQIGFFAVMSHQSEFETAEEGSIQETFWKRFRSSLHMLDSSKDVFENLGFVNRMFRQQEAVLIINYLIAQPLTNSLCKALVVMIPKTYLWRSSDPESKQHSTGMIMRQGMNTELVAKVKRKLRELFEGGMLAKAVANAVQMLDFGPLIEGVPTLSEKMKCLSKQVNYNQLEVETVGVSYFKLLFVVSVVFLVISFVVLFLENVLKNMQMNIRNNL